MNRYNVANETLTKVFIHRERGHQNEEGDVVPRLGSVEPSVAKDSGTLRD